MPTPDRKPGPEFVEKLIFEDEGHTVNSAGELTYLHGAGRFSLQDATGEFDPRSGGGGITEGQHEGLDRLTHRVNKTGFEVFSYLGNKLTNWTVWTDAGKTKKIREEQYAYTGNKVTSYIEIQYDAAGGEKERNTFSSFNYTGNRLDAVTRTHTP